MGTALVLIDIQKGILLSDQVAWEDPNIPKATLCAAGSVLRAARSAGLLIVHVGVVRPGLRGTLDEIRTANARKTGQAPRDIIALTAGSSDIDFVLESLPSEEIVYKVGVSAFQGTRLDALLRNACVSDVVVAGVFTHMAVESTVRQGFDIGYRMSVVGDACCSPRTALHENSMSLAIPNFASTLNVTEATEFFLEHASKPV